MAKRKRTAPPVDTRRPAHGPWVEGEPGWQICPEHDYGIIPGGTCVMCRVDAMREAR